MRSLLCLRERGLVQVFADLCVLGVLTRLQPKAKVLTDEDIAHKKKLQAEQKALKAAAANMKGAGGKKKKK